MAYPRYSLPGPAYYVASGAWAKVGRGRYRHESGVEVTKTRAGRWRISMGPASGEDYGSMSAAADRVNYVSGGHRNPFAAGTALPALAIAAGALGLAASLPEKKRKRNPPGLLPSVGSALDVLRRAPPEQRAAAARATGWTPHVGEPVAVVGAGPHEGEVGHYVSGGWGQRFVSVRIGGREVQIHTTRLMPAAFRNPGKRPGRPRKRPRKNSAAAAAWLTQVGLSLAASQYDALRRKTVPERVVFLRSKLSRMPLLSPAGWAARSLAKSDSALNTIARAIGDPAAEGAAKAAVRGALARA